MADHITHDKVYNTVEPDDFPAMLGLDRYAARTDAFDEIISATHDHFWDPMDPAYIDYTTPFDMENQMLMPENSAPELNTAIADMLDEKQKIKLVGTVCISFHLLT